MPWVVLGAVNIDVEGAVDASVLADRSLDNVQEWVEWRVVAGGTAGNLARHLSDLGQESVLLAIVGDDEIGTAALRLLQQDASRCRVTACRVDDSSTGVVVLMTVAGRGADSRIVLGPRRSAVDVVSCDEVMALLEGFWPSHRDLIVDGYLMRSPREDWLSRFERLADESWRLHCELVPHNIGERMGRDDLFRLFAACQTLSADIATIEGLLGLRHDVGSTPHERAYRLASVLDGDRARLPPVVIGRFGEMGAEYAVRCGRHGAPALVHYALEPSEQKSVGDRLFAEELTGVVSREAHVTNLR
jgi:sugar/nucleoside kinase (ribokinase family)